MFLYNPRDGGGGGGWKPSERQKNSTEAVEMGDLRQSISNDLKNRIIKKQSSYRLVKRRASTNFVRYSYRRKCKLARYINLVVRCREAW